MAVTIPPRLHTGNRLLDVWSERIVRCLQSQRICASPTVRVNADPNGTTLDVLTKQSGGVVGAGNINTVCIAQVTGVTGSGYSALYAVTDEFGNEFEDVLVSDSILDDNAYYTPFAVDDWVLLWNDGTEDPLIFSVPPVETFDAISSWYVDPDDGKIYVKTTATPKYGEESDPIEVGDTIESKETPCYAPGS